MALDLDAGPNHQGKDRRVIVVLDARANVLEVVDRDQIESSAYKSIPRFGPVDVKPGVYREMRELQRAGNPKVFQRKSGRQIRRKPLSTSLGERAPNLEDMKHRLLQRRGQ